MVGTCLKNVGAFSFVNYLGDIAPAKAYIACLTVITSTSANFAWQVEIGQELHLDLDQTFAATVV